MAKDPKPKGRPTDYDISYVARAEHYALLGATNDMMAKFFDVAPSTISLWMKIHPAFSEAIKMNRADADGNVVKALYKRAQGYTTKEVSFEKIGSKEEAMEINPAGEIDLTDENIFKIKTTVKEMPPDVAAAFIWLKNRQPELWRDKKQVEANHTGLNFNFNFKSGTKNEPLKDPDAPEQIDESNA